MRDPEAPSHVGHDQRRESHSGSGHDRRGSLIAREEIAGSLPAIDELGFGS